MKFSQLEYFCFALCIYLVDAKNVRQIGSLVPIDDWLDFKNRTRDVKPLDKLFGKLRATYDFVFHKADNVSNVEKILGMSPKETSVDDMMKINSTDTFFEKDKATDVVKNVSADGKASVSSSSSIGVIEKKSMSPKLSSIRWPNEGLERRLDELEKFEETMPLSRLELIDDESTENFDAETLDSTMPSYHSKFQLPYAIARALLQWIISLYYSAYNSVHHGDNPTRESA